MVRVGQEAQCEKQDHIYRLQGDRPWDTGSITHMWSVYHSPLALATRGPNLLCVMLCQGAQAHAAVSDSGSTESGRAVPWPGGLGQHFCLCAVSQSCSQFMPSLMEDLGMAKDRGLCRSIPYDLLKCPEATYMPTAALDNLHQAGW